MRVRPDAAAARAHERQAMVRCIEAQVEETAAWIGRKQLASRVLEAMLRVPRHEFVPADAAPMAYANSALPIGRGQTISQPYIVALMTDLAEVAAEDTVLEVGTGSGYQAAVLAELAKHVVSLEIVPELAREARERLARLGYDNVEVREGDGYSGWLERAPFDAILVAAAATEIPPPLIEQLRPGGRLVIPVGRHRFAQELVVLEKDDQGNVARRDVLPVAFVPLTRR